jgi:ABC-type microcin C transport system duplicated ATPase subunit YejF
VRVEVKVYEVNLGWSTVEVVLVNLAESVDATVVAGLSKTLNELLVGLPEGVGSPCSLALAYLYTLEDLEVGSRIKSKPILLLANLLGLSQVRDVVETVRECKTLALIGAPGGPRGAIVEVLNRLGIKDHDIRYEEAKCSVEELERVTLSRVHKL